jgi:histone-arginine methyltransferase CARM1
VAIIGAKHVYAVEASDMAQSARLLVEANGLSSVVTILQGKIEQVELPEKVDLVISEPMGFLLVHERMLEAYVAGRARFGKPGCKMFPTTGTMYFLPFSDWTLYSEQYAKAQFWKNTDFYGLDFSSLVDEAIKQHFSQPVVGTFDPSVLISDLSYPASHSFDFEKVEAHELLDIEVPFSFKIHTTTLLHGLACWFDVDFIGTHRTIRLSTSPMETTTHWYQARLLLPKPIAVNEGQSVSGTILMKANEHFSYDIDLTVLLDGTNVKASNRINLQDQLYHYLQ